MNTRLKLDDIHSSSVFVAVIKMLSKRFVKMAFYTIEMKTLIIILMIFIDTESKPVRV